MFFKSQYLDSTALSNKGVPLPACAAENILLFCSDVYFRFSVKQVQGHASSRSGAFYLTNLRIIYVPADGGGFRSFFLPLTQVSSVDPGVEIRCCCDSDRVGIVVLNFKSSQSDLYFSEIAKAVRDAKRAHHPESDKEDSSTLPYYSDICDIE